MPSDQPLAMPSMEQALAKAPGDLTATQPWYRFWLGLYQRDQTGVPYEVESGVAASGATQGTATELNSDWSEITTGILNTGVLLNNFGIGFASWIWNATATAKKVYPPVGCSIDGGAADAPYSLAAGKAQVFNQLTATAFQSLQLG